MNMDSIHKHTKQNIHTLSSFVSWKKFQEVKHFRETISTFETSSITNYILEHTNILSYMHHNSAYFANVSKISGCVGLHQADTTISTLETLSITN